jgi:hypothetical protein
MNQAIEQVNSETGGNNPNEWARKVSKTLQASDTYLMTTAQCGVQDFI